MKVYHLWKRVKSQVRAHRVSLKNFAEYIDVPRSTFFRWMQVGIVPDVYTAYNISTALGVSIEYLIIGKDRKSEEIRMKQTEARKSSEARVRKLAGKLNEEVGKLGVSS